MASKARPAIKNIHRLIQTSTKPQLSPEASFLDDLKRCIEMLNDEESRTPSQSYKPSSMNCIRNMYFQMVKAEQDASSSNSCFVGICQSGTDRHERLQGAISHMRRLGFDCDYLDVGEYIKEYNIPDLEIVKKDGYETKLRHTKLNLSFKCDGVIRYKNILMILEIKTESMHKWVMRSDVAEDHINQGSCYSEALKLNRICWIYENRDNCDKKVYFQLVTDQMHKNIIDKITTCDEYVNSRVIPPMPTDVSKKTCMYCNYKTLCGENR